MMISSSTDRDYSSSAIAAWPIIEPAIRPFPLPPDTTFSLSGESRRGDGESVGFAFRQPMPGWSETAPKISGAEEWARAIAIQVELQVRSTIQAPPQTRTIDMLGDEAELEGAAAVGLVVIAYSENAGASEAAASR
ncbi:hypothetical protein [Fulvimarina sp. MAC3]|uniref:hypothetical protein n=1 Tax=Fulvimarina sp. MAC3 TaxID=3148887 RepID=UPI0031FC4E34